MQDSYQFVDIHCHMLPGIDDGAASWEESLAMARLAANDGFSTIVATPHQLGNFGINHGDTVRTLARQFQGLLAQQGIPLQILPGADVRIEPDMIQKIRMGEVLTLADRGRYVLLELPHEVYLPLDRLLEDLRRAGMIGILSHPERNQGILRQPRVLGPLVEEGCLMQVTAGSIAGTFGPQIQEFAEWMVSQGWVHFLATDAHGPKARRPLMRHAFERVADLVGERAAVEMCCIHPAQVVADEIVTPGPRHSKRQAGGFAKWFRWRKAG